MKQTISTGLYPLHKKTSERKSLDTYAVENISAKTEEIIEDIRVDLVESYELEPEIQERYREVIKQLQSIRNDILGKKLEVKQITDVENDSIEYLNDLVKQGYRYYLWARPVWNGPWTNLMMSHIDDLRRIENRFDSLYPSGSRISGKLETLIEEKQEWLDATDEELEEYDEEEGEYKPGHRGGRGHLTETLYHYLHRNDENKWGEPQDSYSAMLNWYYRNR